MQKFLLIFEGNSTAEAVSKYIPARFTIRKESDTFITADHKYEFLEVAELEHSEETLLEWFDEDSFYTYNPEHSFIELLYSEKSLATDLVKAIAEKEKLLGIQLGILFIKTTQFLRLETEYINLSCL
jgi:hypothetical protein